MQTHPRSGKPLPAEEILQQHYREYCAGCQERGWMVLDFAGFLRCYKDGTVQL